MMGCAGFRLTQPDLCVCCGNKELARMRKRKLAVWCRGDLGNDNTSHGLPQPGAPPDVWDYSAHQSQPAQLCKMHIRAEFTVGVADVLVSSSQQRLCSQIWKEDMEQARHYLRNKTSKIWEVPDRNV